MVKPERILFVHYGIRYCRGITSVFFDKNVVNRAAATGINGHPSPRSPSSILVSSIAMQTYSSLSTCSNSLTSGR
jgi:hypothetical protein